MWCVEGCHGNAWLSVFWEGLIVAVWKWRQELGLLQWQLKTVYSTYAYIYVWVTDWRWSCRQWGGGRLTHQLAWLLQLVLGWGRSRWQDIEHNCEAELCALHQHYHPGPPCTEPADWWRWRCYIRCTGSLSTLWFRITSPWEALIKCKGAT